MSNPLASVPQEQNFFRTVDLFAENLATELINKAVTECCNVDNNNIATSQKLLNAHTKPGNLIPLLDVECGFLLNIASKEIIFSTK